MHESELRDREQFIADVIAVFLNYLDNAGSPWASIITESLVCGEAPHGGDVQTATIEVVDGGEWHKIDHTTVNAGYKVLRESLHTGPSAWGLKMLIARKMHDPAKVTPEDANRLIQLGLFGRIRYPV